MIKTLLLENFRGHTNTRLHLSQFTLLVGANSVGKTSVLSAIELLAELSRSSRPKALVDGVLNADLKNSTLIHAFSQRSSTARPEMRA